ncbi:MAG: hypothetical protein KGL64_04010, partial [Acidobacteriota bacterium]|nr:hypothetical protein [Acidobacteriota bacterium]
TARGFAAAATRKKRSLTVFSIELVVMGEGSAPRLLDLSDHSKVYQPLPKIRRCVRLVLPALVLPSATLGAFRFAACAQPPDFRGFRQLFQSSAVGAHSSSSKN